MKKTHHFEQADHQRWIFQRGYAATRWYQIQVCDRCPASKSRYFRMKVKNSCWLRPFLCPTSCTKASTSLAARSCHDVPRSTGIHWAHCPHQKPASASNHAVHHEALPIQGQTYFIRLRSRPTMSPLREEQHLPMIVDGMIGWVVLPAS